MPGPLQEYFNRREFLGVGARNAATVAAGVAASVVALQSEGRAAAGERVRLAGIGLRNQGKGVCSGLSALPDVEFAALCDIDEAQFGPLSSEIEKRQGKKPVWESDFRRLLDDKSIDAVVIATPDHWHANMTILACQAGKDVYVEKPISHNLLEGVRMVEAAGKYQRVVQVGTQQRSGSHFKSAVDYVNSGKLGTVNYAKAWTVSQRSNIGKKSETAVPPGVNYDLWLGPAPERPFQPNRFHYNWRWFWDYATGELGNWGVHMLDIARWGLGVELPTTISGMGDKLYFDDDQETPDCLVVNYSFPGGKMLTWEQRLFSKYGLDGRSAAAAFYGDKGTLIVDRGGWKVYGDSESPSSDTSDQSGAHYRNFIDCIKSRSTPNADILTGHLSTALCHLGTISQRVGKTIEFNPQNNSIPNDPAAEKLLTREYRKGYELPVL
ncbi:MAG: Gfo/Idh/MocA family oxidoreductase [Planctomycetaceae bacterium]|nr:Gfo/Idh/MocA family oxidoreductase [Planctomycetaceae bacterium]